MMRELLSYLFEWAGVALVAWGLRMIYEPLAWLWAGGILIVVAVAIARPARDGNGPTDSAS